MVLFFFLSEKYQVDEIRSFLKGCIRLPHIKWKPGNLESAPAGLTARWLVWPAPGQAAGEGARKPRLPGSWRPGTEH